jgi:DNA-binding NtrC family response regulator
MDLQARHELSSKTVPTLQEACSADAFHVCLAGSSVSNNWTLIESLKRRYQVTVIETLDLLLRNSILSTVDVLLLDCEEGGAVGIETLQALRRRHQGLCVVLVNGGLTQNEIAAAFREGVRDYFSNHFNVPLLVERVHYLCSQSRRQQQQY